MECYLSPQLSFHLFWPTVCARSKKMAAYSLRLDLAIEVNRHFLKNEYGDLSFFLLF